MKLLKLTINFSKVSVAFRWNYEYAPFPSSLLCHFLLYPQNLARSVIRMWLVSGEVEAPALLISTENLSLKMGKREAEYFSDEHLLCILKADR